MNKEEKEAIEYFENLDIDLNTLWRIDLKGLEKRRNEILALVDKQQKELEQKDNFIFKLKERLNNIQIEVEMIWREIEKMEK